MTFTNSSDFYDLNKYDALKDLKDLFERMEDDGKTYLITIEEVNEID
jgi:hypothetical protein